MRNHSRGFIVFVAVFAAAALGLVVLVAGGFVMPANGATAKYYPPLLNYWGPSQAQDNVYELLYDYSGGDWLHYPQISRNTDAIPMIKTYLTLPAGASITKNKVLLSPPNNGKFYKKVWYWRPQSPSLNPKRITSTTWLLKFRGLRYSPTADWGFWIDWGTATSQCLKAVAHPMYYKRVKTNGYYHKVLRPIPHAPVQTGYYPEDCTQQ